MLMALDMFAFEIGTLPYQELQQKWAWRYAQTERFAEYSASQFVGPGDETIDLSGVLYPGEGIGDYSQFPKLLEMADNGEAYLLVSGTGEVMGEFFILSVERRQTLFFVDGAPRKSDFTISLKRSA